MADDSIVWSPGRSPRMRFSGGLQSLQQLQDKMNKSLAELKEGKFDHLKGHESVQQLQAKLVRLQDHFDDNIAEVQHSVVENAAFYATNPAVLGGMVKLTEVLGLASVLLAQKSDAIQQLLDTYLKPLEERYCLGKEKFDRLENEVSLYRQQVSAAVEKGTRYEQDVTFHLKNVKEQMRGNLSKEIEKKCAEVAHRNHELERKVKQLEFQLKRKSTTTSMQKTWNTASQNAQNAMVANLTNVSDSADGGSGPNFHKSLRIVEMIEKVGELEELLEHDKGEMLTPMIKDACNYLRTLIQMKDADSGEEEFRERVMADDINKTNLANVSGMSSMDPGQTTNAPMPGLNPMFYSDTPMSRTQDVSPFLGSTRPHPISLKPGGPGGPSSGIPSMTHNSTNIGHNATNLSHNMSLGMGHNVTPSMDRAEPTMNNSLNLVQSLQQRNGTGTRPMHHSIANLGSAGKPMNGSAYARALGIEEPNGNAEEESVFSAPRLG